MENIIRYIECHDGFFMLILTMLCVIANILTVLVAHKQNNDNRMQFKESLRINALPLLHLKAIDEKISPDEEDILFLKDYDLHKKRIEFSVVIEMSNWGVGLAQQVCYEWDKTISKRSAGYVVSLPPKDARQLKVNLILPNCDKQFQIGFRILYQDIYCNKYMQQGRLFVECFDGKAQLKKQYVSAPIYLGATKEGSD